LYVGRTFALMTRYMPPPPPGVAPPVLWGEPNVVRERLGAAVRDIVFDRATMRVPALSVQHAREMIEQSIGLLLKVVQMLAATDPQKLGRFRAEYDAITADYFEDNFVRQGYLMTRATKV
jgi:hypothetical protein